MDNLRQLVELLEEDQADKIIPIGLYFTLTDASNMKKAVDSLLENGFEVDLTMSMGTYYFNFKDASVAKSAHKVVAKVIDKKKEEKWSD
jgi:hypothetical protein